MNAFIQSSSYHIFVLPWTWFEEVKTILQLLLSSSVFVMLITDSTYHTVNYRYCYISPFIDCCIDLGRPYLCHCRPDIGHGELYIGRCDSPISEIGAYPGMESDMETNPPRDCHSPVSSVDELERAVAGSTSCLLMHCHGQ